VAEREDDSEVVGTAPPEFPRLLSRRELFLSEFLPTVL
jgi:hypothetical protein